MITQEMTAFCSHHSINVFFCCYFFVVVLVFVLFFLLLLFFGNGLSVFFGNFLPDYSSKFPENACSSHNR